MTSIRVPDIIQIQMLAVRKCAADSSPYVRRCAANAAPKLSMLDREQVEPLKKILDKLLRDSSTMVLGAAVGAFAEVCPDDFELLHRSYRKLCHLLADMDEWCQILTLHTLLRYARVQFVDPSPGASEALRVQAQQRAGAGLKAREVKKIKRRVVKKAFYSDEEDESDEEEIEISGAGGGGGGDVYGLDAGPAGGPPGAARPEAGSAFAGTSGADVEAEGDLDPDHRLLLRSSLPLLKSRNAGVVLAVCTLHYYVGTMSVGSGSLLGRALVRILRNKREIQFVVLHAIAAMAQERPQIFRPFLADFYISVGDAAYCRALKLDVLTALVAKDSTDGVLRELTTYAKSADDAELVCCAARAAGRVADAQPEVAEQVLGGLMALVTAVERRPEGFDAPERVVEQCVVVVRQLLQQGACKDAEARGATVRKLARLLLEPEKESRVLSAPDARANAIWMLAEWGHEAHARVLPDALRLLAAGFGDEPEAAKLQILNLAVKLSLGGMGGAGSAADSAAALAGAGGAAVQPMLKYILELSRYDRNTDLRDRTRYFTALLGLAPAGLERPDEQALTRLRGLAPGIALAPKLPPLTLTGDVALEGASTLMIGSLSAMVGHQVLRRRRCRALSSARCGPQRVHAA